jgi:hypothetical protein
MGRLQVWASTRTLDTTANADNEHYTSNGGRWYRDRSLGAQSPACFAAPKKTRRYRQEQGAQTSRTNRPKQNEHLHPMYFNSRDQKMKSTGETFGHRRTKKTLRQQQKVRPETSTHTSQQEEKGKVKSITVARHYQTNADGITPGAANSLAAN